MKEKSISEVVGEFKDAFGLVEFKATNFETGQVGGSKKWKEPAAARLEITGDDYLVLGNLAGGNCPVEGVIAGLLKIELGKR
jgi:hypothetical protein